jgi:hypothetical protein
VCRIDKGGNTVGPTTILTMPVGKLLGHISQGMPSLLIRDSMKAQKLIAAAKTDDEVLQIGRWFMRRHARMQPEVADNSLLAPRLKLRACRDLFFWWLEFDRLVNDSRNPSAGSRLGLCRDVLGAAWERAAALGYKLS